MLLCEHCSGHLNEHAFKYCYAFYNGILPTPLFGVATQQQRIENNNSNTTATHQQQQQQHQQQQQQHQQHQHQQQRQQQKQQQQQHLNRATKVAAMGNIFLFSLTVQGLLVGRHSLQIALLLIPGVAMAEKLNDLFLFTRIRYG